MYNISKIMEKKKTINELHFVSSRKIFKHGNSKAIPIPKDVVKDLNLKIGERLVVSMNKDSEIIVLSKPKNLSDSKSDISFELSLPKELVKKLLEK